ncbi:MAG TPA: ABC transporter ATP-binding protein [Thermotogota bacterium]|nr:ABC transporter ATP-binding protein [Thermotogota bacterium]HRW93536.1 ABC transporter ATP-binding protein [Thermotogota bacterium]
MIALQLEGLSKRYGTKVWGAKDVNLQVSEQEFIVFLGPSGCGKTTTLRMIAGLEEVTEGRILIHGKEVTDLPPRSRDISMVFQSYAVWPHMTVFENIAFPLKLKKLTKEQIADTVHAVSDMTNISPYLERYPRQLSGGQRQRVALARAIAVKPKLFLMDEPLSNLDAKLRVRMRTELKAIHHRTQATTVFVTHDQAEAMSMADRIVIMENGKIIQIGTPDQVYFDSANVFVAGFIGTPPTNFIPVDWRMENGTTRLLHPDFQFDAPDALARILQQNPPSGDGKILLGIRPESMKIVDNPAVLSTSTLVVEPQGSHQIVAFELQGQILKILAPPFPKVREGQTIHVDFEWNRVMLFDENSGLRLKEKEVKA